MEEDQKIAMESIDKWVEKGILQNYQGALIFASEYQFLKELEPIVGSLSIHLSSNGIWVENGHVIGIYLYSFNHKCKPEFWEKLVNLPRLRNLELRYAKLSTFPSILQDLQDLEEINFTNNPISRMPPFISKLPKLSRLLVDDKVPESLYYRSNFIQSYRIEPNQRDAVEKIEKQINRSFNIGGRYEPNLILKSGQVTALQVQNLSDLSSLAAFSQLELLELGRCSASIPSFFQTFKKLKEVRINQSNLTIIPKELLSIPNLEKLDLSENQITSISAEISACRLLKELKLDHNQIQQIPKEIGDLQQLTVLSIAQNQLQQVPPEISLCIALETVKLENNLLTTLPSQFGNLRNLKWLNLSTNKIESLPDSLIDLRMLENIMLISNQLPCIPTFLTQLPKLAHIRLDHNQISTLPNQWHNLSAIQELRLDHNNLSEIPEYLAKKIIDDKIKVFPNPFSALPLSMIEGYSHQYPKMDLNEKMNLVLLAKNMDTTFQLMKRFEHRHRGFTLYNQHVNGLSMYYKEFMPYYIQYLKAFPKLTRLSLIQTSIKELPKEICEFTSLTELDLERNQLSGLPEFANLIHIDNLNLANNNLKDIPWVIGSLNALKRLKINPNPWEGPVAPIAKKGTKEIKNYCRGKNPDWHGQTFLPEDLI